jgi:hypothetical protein
MPLFGIGFGLARKLKKMVNDEKQAFKDQPVIHATVTEIPTRHDSYVTEIDDLSGLAYLGVGADGIPVYINPQRMAGMSPSQIENMKRELGVS